MAYANVGQEVEASEVEGSISRRLHEIVVWTEAMKVVLGT